MVCNESLNNIKLENIADHIYHAWLAAWENNDKVDTLLAFYADNAIIESPFISYLLDQERGVCKGKTELRKLIAYAVHKRKPHQRYRYIGHFLTDGKTLIWEYPRITPEGEQKDFIEVIELENGLIHRHCVYWGWFGFYSQKS